MERDDHEFIFSDKLHCLYINRLTHQNEIQISLKLMKVIIMTVTESKNSWDMIHTIPRTVVKLHVSYIKDKEN